MVFFINQPPPRPLTKRLNPSIIGWVDFGLKGIVSLDWKGLQMVSLDRFEV
jgi:hypothetical protein